MEYAAPIAVYLLVINTITFLSYGYDKTAAIKNNGRIPESKLHLMELLGGSPAAIVAQKVFSHKTKKGSFQSVFWIIVVTQGLVIATLLNKGVLN